MVEPGDGSRGQAPTSPSSLEGGLDQPEGQQFTQESVVTGRAQTFGCSGLEEIPHGDPPRLARRESTIRDALGAGSVHLRRAVRRHSTRLSVVVRWPPAFLRRRFAHYLLSHMYLLSRLVVSRRRCRSRLAGRRHPLLTLETFVRLSVRLPSGRCGPASPPKRAPVGPVTVVSLPRARPRVAGVPVSGSRACRPPRPEGDTGTTIVRRLPLPYFSDIVAHRARCTRAKPTTHSLLRVACSPISRDRHSRRYSIVPPPRKVVPRAADAACQHRRSPMQVPTRTGILTGRVSPPFLGHLTGPIPEVIATRSFRCLVIPPCGSISGTIVESLTSDARAPSGRTRAPARGPAGPGARRGGGRPACRPAARRARPGSYAGGA